MIVAFERAEKAFIYGLLMMAVGAISIAISVFTGVSLLHSYLAFTLLLVGLFLLVLGRLAMRSLRGEFLGEDRKDPDRQGDWVHLGGGLYCRKQDIEDRDKEIKRKAEYEAYMKRNSSNTKKEK